MSKIDEIENKLQQINDAKFQKMCDTLLFYKGYETIGTGSVIGKEKTRKGLPDSYVVLPNGGYAFIEFTTKEKLGTGKSFFKKLKGDIIHCFDPKSGIKPNQINEVILCYTNRIEANESEELKNLCKTYYPNCKLIEKGIDTLKHEIFSTPGIAKEFLGITVDTGQILIPNEFTKQYEKSKIATPLSNTFYHRESDTQTALMNLNNKPVLVIKGVAGVGKSRLALHIIDEFKNQNPEYTLYCISSKKGLGIWDDLSSYILPDKNYIVLIDDANKSNEDFYHLLSLLKTERTGDIKIIATVRDYALNDILQDLEHYDYSVQLLDKFKDEEIKEIIQSKEFNIQNPVYVDRILRIAKGNARLAIMAAIIGKDNPINELDNASIIYDKYFESISSEIEELNDINLTKSLAILSFSKVISREHEEYNSRIFTAFDISENTFWESIYTINKLGSEIIDLFENQIVKISDQILTTYLFYKVFFKDKKLDYNIILDNFLVDQSKNIRDTIIPITNDYSLENIKELIGDNIINKWNSVKNDDTIAFKFLDIFWYFLPTETLQYLKNIISSLPPSTETFKYEYETNEFAYTPPNNIFNLLTQFRLIDPNSFEISLDLIFEYIFKFPSYLARFIKFSDDHLIYHRMGYQNGYIRQKMFIDFLIRKSKEETDLIRKIVYTKFLISIAKSFLKTAFQQNESNGMRVVFYSYTIPPAEEIKEIRKKIFSFIFNNFKSFPKDVYNVLDKYTWGEANHSQELWEYDSSFILDFIESELDRNEYLHSKLVYQYLDTLKRYGIKYKPSLRNEFLNDLFRLSELLNQDRIHRKRIKLDDNFQEKKNKELTEYCSSFGYDEYVNLLSDYQAILNQEEERNHWSFSESITTILYDLSVKNEDLFIKILEYILKNGNKLKIHSNRIISNKLLSNKHNEIFNLIEKYEFENKLSWQHGFFEMLPKECINPYYCNELVKSFYSIDFNTGFHRWEYVEKYNIWEPKWHEKLIAYFSRKKKIEIKNIFTKITSILLKKIQKEKLSIAFGYFFFEQTMEYFDEESFYLVEDIYLSQDNQNFDFDRRSLKAIVERNNNFIYKYIDKEFTEFYSSHGSDNLDFLWELETWEEIITKCVQIMEQKEKFFSSSSMAANALFKSAYTKDIHKQKVLTLIEKLIREKSMDIKAIQHIFNIISYSIRDRKVEMLKLFLDLNSDFKFFKEICFYLGHDRMVYSGSMIPYIEQEIELWNNVLNMLKNMSDKSKFLNHINLIEAEVRYCKKRIVREQKESFTDEL